MMDCNHGSRAHQRLVSFIGQKMNCGLRSVLSLRLKYRWHWTHQPSAIACWSASGGPVPIGRQRPPIQGLSIASTPATTAPSVPDPPGPSEPPFRRTGSGLKASAAGELTAITLARVVNRLRPMANKYRATQPPPEKPGGESWLVSADQYPNNKPSACRNSGDGSQE